MGACKWSNFRLGKIRLLLVHGVPEGQHQVHNMSSRGTFRPRGSRGGRGGRGGGGPKRKFGGKPGQIGQKKHFGPRFEDARVADIG